MVWKIGCRDLLGGGGGILCFIAPHQIKKSPSFALAIWFGDKLNQITYFQPMCAWITFSCQVVLATNALIKQNHGVNHIYDTDMTLGYLHERVKKFFQHEVHHTHLLVL